jgi:hypothetical protein
MAMAMAMAMGSVRLIRGAENIGANTYIATHFKFPSLWTVALRFRVSTLLHCLLSFLSIFLKLHELTLPIKSNLQACIR